MVQLTLLDHIARFHEDPIIGQFQRSGLGPQVIDLNRAISRVAVAEIGNRAQPETIQNRLVDRVAFLDGHTVGGKIFDRKGAPGLHAGGG